MMRYLPAMAFVIVVMLLAALLVLRPETPAESHDPRALPQLTLESFSGKERWDQQALRGQVTVLNFFASWCAPCEVEMPELAAVKKQFPQVNLYGVAWNDNAQKLGAWLEKHGEPFDMVWIDDKGVATIGLGIKGIPETIIVDGEGIVRYRLSGPLTEAVRLREVVPLLESLASGGADAR